MFYHALTGNGRTENLEPVLLWENSNPTVEFTAQTVSLDLSDYAGVIVEFKKTTTSTKINTRLYAKKNEDVDEIFGAGSYYTKGDSNTARGVNVTDTGVTFAEGYRNMTSDNNTTIPIRIYGVKEYVVEPQQMLSKTLLWTNPNPTASFGTAGTITSIGVDASPYEKIIVEYRKNTTSDDLAIFMINTDKIIEAPQGNEVCIGSSASGQGKCRLIAKDSNNILGFKPLYQAEEYAIPTRVFGINGLDI